jgi:hypothetical protein
MSAYAIHAPKTYRLAKNRPFQIEGFGPLMTLDMATKYQAELSSVYPDILVINTEGE